jgi:hypothetical protein
MQLLDDLGISRSLKFEVEIVTSVLFIFKGEFSHCRTN